MIKLAVSAGAFIVQCLLLEKLFAKDWNGLGIPGISMVIPPIEDELTFVVVNTEIPVAEDC